MVNKLLQQIAIWIEIEWTMIKKYCEPTTVPELKFHTANIYKNLMYVFRGRQQAELYVYNFG